MIKIWLTCFSGGACSKFVFDVPDCALHLESLTG